MKPKKDKYPDLMAWFDFMNQQFRKIEGADQKAKINSLLNDNDIEPLL